MKNRSQEIYNDHDYLFLSRRTYAYVKHEKRVKRSNDLSDAKSDISLHYTISQTT